MVSETVGSRQFGTIGSLLLGGHGADDISENSFALKFVNDLVPVKFSETGVFRNSRLDSVEKLMLFEMVFNQRFDLLHLGPGNILVVLSLCFHLFF